jgi:hypothetical protein
VEEARKKLCGDGKYELVVRHKSIKMLVTGSTVDFKIGISRRLLTLTPETEPLSR